MKSRTVRGLAVAALLPVASTGLHAQLGGLIKKKAGDLLKGKPAPTETKPAPEPTPDPAPEAGAPATPGTPAATPDPAGSGDPLDVSNLSLTSNVNRYVQEEQPVPEGEWNQMPFFGSATRAALRMLDDPGLVAFIEKTGPAIKALVQSDTFGKAHADYIRQEFDAVDHGLKGVLGLEDFMKKQDYAGMEAFTRRQSVMNIVESVGRHSAAHDRDRRTIVAARRGAKLGIGQHHAAEGRARPGRHVDRGGCCDRRPFEVAHGHGLQRARRVPAGVGRGPRDERGAGGEGIRERGPPHLDRIGPVGWQQISSRQARPSEWRDLNQPLGWPADAGLDWLRTAARGRLPRDRSRHSPAA